MQENLPTIIKVKKLMYPQIDINTIMPPENETGFFGRKNVKGKTR